MSDIRKRFSMTGPMVLGIATMLLLVGGFGTWAAVSNISGAIIAAGQIEVDSNRQVVQHPDGGVVAEIRVREGDIVEKGDVLVRLDSTLIASQLAISEGQYFELVARRGRLEAERDGADAITFDAELLERAADDETLADLAEGQRRLFRARNTSVRQEIEQLRKRRQQIADQVNGIDAQRLALSEQLRLIEQELADQKKLQAQGLTQASRVLALQREQARLSGQMGELTAQKAQAQGRVTEIDIEILKMESRRREQAITELRDLQYRERELAEQIRALKEQLSRLDVTAPVSGVVYGLTVFAERAVIRPAEPILYIVPQDRPLVVAAQVPTIHIDQIYVGQPVSVRFPAFDQRSTPELFGRVVQVSADAFRDDKTGASFYRVRIELNEGETARLPPDARLIPGMPAEAFIRTRDRTPLAYLIKPMADYFRHAFRES